MKKLRYLLLVSVVAGCLFQTGHFIEHAVQFGVYIAGNHTAPYMSPIAMDLTHRLGGVLFAGADMKRQMMMGMEVLHLIGNTIFLVTIAGLYYFMRAKFLRQAFYIEGFHLYEHIMLTCSALWLDNPVGLSTLFGGAIALGGPEIAVGYRVSWHFILNLVPSVLVMVALMRARKEWVTQTLSIDRGAVVGTLG